MFTKCRGLAFTLSESLFAPLLMVHARNPTIAEHCHFGGASTTKRTFFFFTPLQATFGRSCSLCPLKMTRSGKFLFCGLINCRKKHMCVILLSSTARTPAAWVCTTLEAFGPDTRGVLTREILSRESRHTSPKKTDLGGWRNDRERHHQPTLFCRRVWASTPNAALEWWKTRTCHCMARVPAGVPTFWTAKSSFWRGLRARRT